MNTRGSEGNSGRVVAALAEFGFGIITSISGVSFDDARDSRTAGTLDGVATQFIGREALIRNKESTGRAKDLGDVDELRKRSRTE